MLKWQKFHLVLALLRLSGSLWVQLELKLLKLKPIQKATQQIKYLHYLIFFIDFSAEH